MKKSYFIALIISYYLFSVFIITRFSYNFYHGWYEGYLSLIGKNYFITGDLWHQVAYLGAGQFISVPPLFSYIIYTSFALFGISDFNARIVPVLSSLVTSISLYYLVKTLYDTKTAQTSVIVFLFIPWNVLWFNRIMPDTLTTALVTASLCLYVMAQKNNSTMLYCGIISGLAVFSKQPALVILPIVLLWTHLNHFKPKLSFIPFFIIGLIPISIWLFVNRDIFFYMVVTELTERSVPFENIIRTVGTFILFTSPFIYYFIKQVRQETHKNIFIIWFILYGIYVLIRTPLSHEYYSLLLTVPLSALAAIYVTNHNISLTKPVLISIPITLLLLYGGGSIGYHATSDVGNFIKSQDNPQVFVPVMYTPQIVWYGNLTSKDFESTGNDFNQTYIDQMSDNDRMVLIVINDGTDGINITYPMVYHSQNLEVYRRT